MRELQSWTLPFGTLLAAGALGLLAAFAVPTLGTLAAAGVLLYFVDAYLRARNHQFGPGPSSSPWRWLPGRERRPPWPLVTPRDRAM